MLNIEEYMARRKKEDNLNEFDIDARTQNMKICVDYVFEYFNNYLDITEAEEKTVLQNEKLEKYRKQLREYEPKVREWIVGIYNEYGKQMHRYIVSPHSNNAYNSTAPLVKIDLSIKGGAFHMPEQKLTIVPVTLHSNTENTPITKSTVSSSNSTCTIKFGKVEISFSNGIDEHIIQTVMRELKDL